MSRQNERIILHCDANSFYASVELLDFPQLKDKPVAVSGSPDFRHGIILAKNDVAKKYGVVTAETVWSARKKCPELILLPPHRDKYRHYSKLLNEIYQSYTDLVEPFSIDESWLDVTASLKLFGDGKTIANAIREKTKNELGITVSVGVSFNKIFAKMGSEYKKPDATTVINRENFKALLWSMPVSELFFVGFSTAQKLNSVGVNTIGDLARIDLDFIQKNFGKQGPVLRAYARGEDNSPVKPFNQRNKIKSVGNGITFSRDLINEADIQIGISALSDTVASRLRKYQLKANGVKVDIKDTKLKTISRQKRLDSPTDLAREIRNVALGIIKTSWPENKPIRMLTITGINLTDHDDIRQLSLFDSNGQIYENNKNLEKTMDEIRNKFGDNSISFGITLNNDIGIDF